MLSPNLVLKRLRNVVPNKDVHPKRKVALLQRLAQVTHLSALLRSGEHDQVKIR